MRASTTALVCTLLGFSSAIAQTPSRPEHWPDAATVTQQFVTGQTGPPIVTAVATCPHDNPYGDTVWAALLSRPLTDAVTARLSVWWSEAVRTCNDARIGTWYRDRLSEQDNLFDAHSFIGALIRAGGDQNLQALRQFAFDEAKNGETRSFILRALGGDDWDVRLELYLDLVRSNALPQPYGVREWGALSWSPIRHSFAQRAFRLVKEHPSPATAVLLQRLASRITHGNEEALRRDLRALALEIVNEPDRFTPEVVRAAVYAKAELERTR